jgi:hypothetical protein
VKAEEIGGEREGDFTDKFIESAIIFPSCVEGMQAE